MSDYILVTGGAGYIGSHTVIELINNGYKVVIADNLSNSSYDAVARIEYIVRQQIPFFNVDLRNYEQLSKVFKQYKISGVIHFAALKAVGESTTIPLAYYDNNVGGTISLLNVMKDNGVKNIVFSSSATVYGDVTRFGDNSMIPIPENCPTDPTNPYGNTKYIIETLLKDIYNSDPNNWTVAILRYFNPIGAHPSGLIGEDPLGIPNNLLPYLAQVAIGRREKLSIFGSDYDSHDGTPIRDYIHVVDLAKGHISALQYLNQTTELKQGLYREWNLGTGKGSTVFDVYHAFCKAVGRELPYEVVGRRAGDVLDLTAQPVRANIELGWKAELNIEKACEDLWKWTTENPFGFNIDNYKWKQFEDSVGYENRLHTVTNGDFKVSFCNHGALIQNISIGEQRLVSGFENGESYKVKSNPFFGTTVGRVANRVGNGTFKLNDKEYSLTQNEGANTLHGGNNGYDKKTFLGPIVRNVDHKTVVEFVLQDKDNQNGFPSDVNTFVKYTVGERELEIEYEAKLASESKDSTIINLTNHSYFNVSGKDTIDGTLITLASDQALEVDKFLVPTGNITPDSRFKSNKPLALTADVSFDNCFAVDKSDFSIDTRAQDLKKIFEASHPDSPIKLVISSTEPAFQLYTGDFTNTEGFGSRSGFAVEAGRYVDAINHKEWEKQVILDKDSVYGSRTKYEFVKN